MLTRGSRSRKREDPSVTATSSGLRARKKAQLREAIEREGMRLFAMQGFEATTVDAIAAACNVSPTTVFRYFPTKEDIVFAREARLGDRLVELVAMQPAELAPTLALHRAVLALCTDFASSRTSVAKTQKMVESSKSLRARKLEAHQRWERLVFAELKRRGDASDRQVDDFTLELVTATALAAFRVSVEVWVAKRGVSLEDLVSDACTLLQQGFRP